MKNKAKKQAKKPAPSKQDPAPSVCTEPAKVNHIENYKERKYS